MVSTGRNSQPGSPTRSGIDSIDEDDYSDSETRGLGETQSMSIATSEESDYDELSHSQRHDRWRRGILRNTNNAQDYSYDYIDENVYVGRGFSCLIPTGKVRLLIAVFVVASILVVFIPREKETKDNVTVRKFKGSPQLLCPEEPILPPSHIFYTNSSSVIQAISNDFDSYRENFRKMEYRDWGISYDAVKEAVRPWKKERFVANLKNGDSIFESGCGVGLNLIMTLEILQEEDIRDVHLYGSTFGDDSAASYLIDGVLTEKEAVGSGKRGVICSANSVDLSFVHENTFDLVFTGHISSHPDPWQNGLGDPEVLAHRDAICKDKNNDWKSATLLEIAQKEQNEWHRKWLENMVLIAKPGAPIIVEQVPSAYCSNGLDAWGGGVSHAFWEQAIEEYSLDVDVASVEFESDILFPDYRRYNVFMRKSK